MGWQVIKQPDGKLGVWSSDPGDWIAKDMDADEIEELFAEEMAGDLARRLRKVRQIVQWVLDGTPEKAYHQFAMTYEEACAPRWDPDDELEEETQP